MKLKSILFAIAVVCLILLFAYIIYKLPDDRVDDIVLGTTLNPGVTEEDIRRQQWAGFGAILDDVVRFVQHNDDEPDWIAADGIIANPGDNTTRHTNDLQNVHDSNVSESVRRKLKRISELCGDNVDFIAGPGGKNISFDEAKQQAAAEVKFLISKYDHARGGDIRRVLARIADGSSITVGSDAIKENLILYQVWHRINDVANANHQATLELALLDALADCVEDSVVVCINGRVSHVVGVLQLLDADPVLAAPLMRRETIINEIYAAAAAIRKKHFAAFPKTAALYNKGVDNAETARLVRRIKREIDAIPNQYTSKKYTQKEWFKNALREAKNYI